jgi:TrmH family RNA methyltransferase
VLSKSRIKYIQSLHHKKFRDEEAAYIAEGTKVVTELLQSGKFICKQLIALPQWVHENEANITKYYAGEITEVKDFELEKISALSSPNQVIAIFEKAKGEVVTVTGKITLVLDTIQDPGNLGTIIRIADWFGVSSIICSVSSADVYNPKVVQSTMGSLSRVTIIYTDLKEWLSKNKQIKIYAAALKGNTINTIKNITEAIIVIGNESKGISDELLQLADEKITIPKIGEAESLNAAVATGIILSHLIK